MKLNFTMFSAIFLSFIWTQNAGMLAKPDEKLISIRGEYNNEDFDGGSTSSTYLGADYILDGNIEFNLMYLMGSTKNDADNTYDFKMNGFGFGGFYHIKENDNIPVNFKVGATYVTNEVKADWLDNLGVSITGETIGFIGGIYKEVYNQEFYNLTAFTTYAYSSAKSKTSGGGLDSTAEESGTGIAFGVIIRSNNLFVTPYIGRVEDNSDTGIQLGILLPQ